MFFKIIFFRARATLCELETEITTVTQDNKLLKRGYQLIFRWEVNWKRRVSWNKTFATKQNILNVVLRPEFLQRYKIEEINNDITTLKSCSFT